MPEKIFVTKMGPPTAAQKAARTISQRTIDLIAKSAAHKAAREATSEKVAVLDRNDPADSVAIAAAELTAPQALPVPTPESIAAHGGGVEGYLKASRALQRAQAKS